MRFRGVFIILFFFPSYLSFSYFWYESGADEVFCYFRAGNVLSFGVGANIGVEKFLFKGVFEYSDFGEFESYEVVNDEYYYSLGSKKVESFYGGIKLGYNFGDTELDLGLGVKNYSELSEELVFLGSLEGRFSVFDFLSVFLEVYNYDLAFGDMGYNVGFSLSTSKLGYKFIDSFGFCIDKSLLYGSFVFGVWALFKIFEINESFWILGFKYRFSFLYEVVDPLRVGGILKIGSFKIVYEVILPLYFWGNYISVGYVF